jgi:hypothetical protein
MGNLGKRFLLGRALRLGVRTFLTDARKIRAFPPERATAARSGVQISRLRGKHSTLRIPSWLPHGALNGSNGWTHNLEAETDGAIRGGLETVGPVCAAG